MVILVPLVETQLHLVLVFIYKEMVEVAEPVYLLVQEMVVVVVEVLLGVVVVGGVVDSASICLFLSAAFSLLSSSNLASL